MEFLEQFLIYAEQNEYFFLILLASPCFVLTLLPAVSLTNRFQISFQHALFYGVGALYASACMAFVVFTVSKLFFINLPLYTYAIIYALNTVICLSNLLKDEYEEKVGYFKGSLVFVAQQIMFVPLLAGCVWLLVEFTIGTSVA